MKKKLLSLTFLIFLILCFSSHAKSVIAASLEFNPTESSININDIVDLDLNVNAGSDEINSIDVYIDYDPKIIEIQSITNGDFFPISFEETSESGRAYYGGMVDVGSFKTGSGKASIVKFKGIKEGTTDVTFFCNLTDNNSSKITKNDNDGTNIIICNDNIPSKITISSSGTTVNPTSTPTPTQTPADDEDTSTGGTGVDTVDTTDEVTELPQSGILDNILRVSIPGVALLLIGVALKLLL